MSKTSAKPIKRKTTKGANRRRQGYELTRQRDMMPVALGAAAAALVVHIVAYLLAPSIFNYTLKSTDEYADKVKDETKRVYFKVKKETLDLPEPEIEEEKPKDKELVEQELEPQDVDLLDTELTELEMRPGDTQLVVKADIAQKNDYLKPLEAPAPAPSEMSMELPEVAAIPQQELMENPDPVPLNANDTIVNLAPQNSDIESEGNTLDENDLKEAARDGMENMPEDTRTLSELLGQNNLGSQSGVARLGADLLFDFNECSLKSSALVSLQQLAALIQINLNTHFIIEGHSDSIGTKAKNAFISIQRAAAVRQWLSDAGVPTERVYIRACAANSPIVNTKGTADEQKLNRRVEIHMRSENEEIPEGCLGNDYSIALDKNVTQLLNSGKRVPQTYKSVSRLKEAEGLKDDDTAEIVSPPPAG